MNSLISSHKVDLFSPIRQWLESLEIRQPKIAHLLCRIIPARCPFEREIKLLNRTIAYIPPLCKLNPFYDQIVEIRFKCLCYLADECGESALREGFPPQATANPKGEDITLYC